MRRSIPLGLAACGGSDAPVEPVAAPDTPDTATQPEPSETATETQPVTEPETEPVTEPVTEPETETEPAEDSPEAVVIRVTGGQPAGGPADISVKAGGTVRLVVRADAPEEVHVHGYDLMAEVGPGTPARFTFVAEFEGVFEIELEESAVEIATLTVEP